MVVSIVEGSIQMQGSVSGTDQTAIGINADANRAQRFFVENPLAIIHTATGIAEFIGAGEVEVTQAGSAIIVSGTPHSPVGGVTSLNALQGILTITGTDGISTTAQDPTITVSGFHGEFVAASGLLQDGIDGIGPGSISDAMLGVDGVTVISGTPTESQTTISGFRDEFVSASGSLQDQIAGPVSSNQKTFAAPTTYFPFTHGLNSTEVEVSFYVDEPGVGERQVGLDEIYVIDANTISGSATIPRAGRLVVVAGGTGGSSAATLQSAYDAGDGIITTTALKPLELQGTGELTAVTGTFTGGLTVGTGTLALTGDEIIFGGDVPVRLTVGGETSILQVEKSVEGLWQPSSLEVGTDTLWVGKNVGIGGIGHHLVTETVDGHFHYHAHGSFKDGLSTKDTQMVYAYSKVEKMVIGSDDTGSWAGTAWESDSTAFANTIGDKIYFKTAGTAATSPIRFQVWQGTDDTGVPIFDQTYPAGDFPANTEIELGLRGYLEYRAGMPYHNKISSASDFSLKTNAAVDSLWFAVDISMIREENILQTKEYAGGEDWNKGDLLIDDRQIYVCLASGTQSGTLAANADKWTNLEYLAVSGTDTQALVTVSGYLQSQITAEDLWDKNGTVLQNKSGVDEFVFNDGPRDRFEVDSTISRLFSPNGSWNLYVNNAAVAMFDGTNHRIYCTDQVSQLNSPNAQKSLIINNTNSTFTGDLDVNGDITATSGTFAGDLSASTLTINGVGNKIRFLNDSSVEKGFLHIVDPQEYIRLEAASRLELASLGESIDITAEDAISISALNGDVQIDAAGAVDLYAIDGVKVSGSDLEIKAGGGDSISLAFKDNLDVLKGYVKFTDDVGDGSLDIFAEGPLTISGNSDISINTSSFVFNDGTNDRFEVGSLSAALYSPDRSLRVGATDSLAYLADSSRNRVYVDTNGTELISPDGTETFKVDDTGLVTTSTVLYTPTEFSIYDGTRSRLLSTTAGTSIVSQNGTYKVEADNTGVILKASSTTNLVVQSTLMYFNDATRDRIKADSTDTRLVSPDGINALVIDDTNVSVTGSLDIANHLTVGSTSGGLVLAPVSPDYGGGQMIFGAPGDGVGGTYSNHWMDSFWGYMRLYADWAGDTQLLLQNIGAGKYNLNCEGTVFGESITATTGAIQLASMTTTQRDALTAVNGMMIYNTTDNKFQGYENGAWANLI